MVYYLTLKFHYTCKTFNSLSPVCIIKILIDVCSYMIDNYAM